MGKRKVNPQSLKNLIDRSAPDNPGDTTATTVRIGSDDLDWLRSQDGGVSYHVRQAVKEYRESMRTSVQAKNQAHVPATENQCIRPKHRATQADVLKAFKLAKPELFSEFDESDLGKFLAKIAIPGVIRIAFAEYKQPVQIITFWDADGVGDINPLPFHLSANGICGAIFYVNRQNRIFSFDWGLTFASGKLTYIRNEALVKPWFKDVRSQTEKDVVFD